MISMALSFAMGGFRKALGWATSSVTHILAVALLAAVAWGWYGWHGKAKAEKVLASTVTGYRNAQAEATAAQNKLDLAISAATSAIAKESADDYPKARDDAHMAVIAYVGRMPACPARQTSEANAPAVPDNSGASVDAGASPALAAITVADLDTLAGNTVRAESCRALGQAWIDAGVAVAGD